MAIRVSIADDHSVVRQGLRMFLSSDPEFEIIGEAQDGAEAVSLALQLRPDVVLMDLRMPVMDGIRATEAIRHEAPDIEVVALTSVLEDGSVSDAVRAGAIGYLLKDTQAHELRRAIKAAATGQVQLSSEAAAACCARCARPKLPPSRSPNARRKCCGCWLVACPTARSPRRSPSASRPSRRTSVTSWTSWACQAGPRPALYAIRNGLVSPRLIRPHRAGPLTRRAGSVAARTG